MGYGRYSPETLAHQRFLWREIAGTDGQVALQLAPELRPEKLYRGRWIAADPDELVELLEKHFPEALVHHEGGVKVMQRGEMGVLVLQVQPVQLGKCVYRIVQC